MQQPRSGRPSNIFRRFGRIGEASTIDISPTPPLIFTEGQKVQKLRRFQHHSTLSHPRLKMQQDIRTLKQRWIAAWSPYDLAEFGQVGSFGKSAPPLKLDGENVNKSEVDYSISLKFSTKFKHITPEVLLVRVQRSRSQRYTTYQHRKRYNLGIYKLSKVKRGENYPNRAQVQSH